MRSLPYLTSHYPQNLISHRKQALGKAAKSKTLDFDEAVRRVLAGEAPGVNPPPIREETTEIRDGGSDMDTTRNVALNSHRGAGSAEEKSEAKLEGVAGGGTGRRGSSGDGRSTRTLGADAAEREESGQRERGDRGRRGSVGKESPGGGREDSEMEEKVECMDHL